MLLLAGAFERYRHQFVAANPRLDQAPNRRLARRVEMTDRIQADEPLRAQGAVEQIGRDFPRRSRLRRPVPAEMPFHQLIGLEHAVALGDRDPAFVERQLQRPLRRLAAGPGMYLLHQHVIVDVADRQRAVLFEEPHHLAQICRLDLAEPFVALAPVNLHGRHEETKIPGRHIGQRVGPVFEHAFVDALGLAQIRAPVFGNAAPENVMVAALDHVDGVDLHVAEVFDGRRRRAAALRRTAPWCRAAGRAARCAWPRPWSGKRVYQRGTSRGNVAGFARFKSRKIAGHSVLRLGPRCFPSRPPGRTTPCRVPAPCTCKHCRSGGRSATHCHRRDFPCPRTACPPP